MQRFWIFRLAFTLVLLLILSVIPLAAIPATAAGDLTLPDAALLTDPVFARPGYAGVAQSFVNRSSYLVSMKVDLPNGRLLGREQIRFVNHTAALLDTVIVRLYQNSPFRQGRRMIITSADVNGQPMKGSTRDVNGTVYAIPLPAPVATGGSTTINLDYQITMATTSFFYISEPFPMLAVYDESGWRTDVTRKGLDWVYSESALSVIKLQTMTDTTLVYVGGTKSAETQPDGTTIYTIVTGPIRNFVFVQGKGWTSNVINGGPVPIRIMFSSNQAGIAQEMSQIAVNAMNYYDANFGPYPYAELDIVSMVTTGEQYPSLVLVDNQRASDYRRFITAHEIAHQWFYGIAGNDLLRHAWLDESTTQVAGYFFYKYSKYGSPSIASEYWSHVLTWYNRIQTVRKIDTALDDFADFNDYMSTVYGGGAVFLRDLGTKIGDTALIAGMRLYAQNVNLGVGTSRQFFDAVQAKTSIDLKPLFCSRVGIMCGN